MTNSSSESLEELIHAASQDWLIHQHAPAENALPYLQSLIDQAGERYRIRWGNDEPRLDLNWMMQEQNLNPHKVQAFLQALGSTENPDMLLMVWCILEGWSIQKVQMEYIIQNAFQLQVTLQSKCGEAVFESASINDAALLRHFGIMTMDGMPIFDGFYALKLD